MDSSNGIKYLTVHVLRVDRVPVKYAKAASELYISLSTWGSSAPGKEKRKRSKTATNPKKATREGTWEWDEHCEFQLTPIDNELRVHLNQKKSGLFGTTTETIGEVCLDIEQLQRLRASSSFPATTPFILLKKKVARKMSNIHPAITMTGGIGAATTSPTPIPIKNSPTPADERGRVHLGIKFPKVSLLAPGSMRPPAPIPRDTLTKVAQRLSLSSSAGRLSMTPNTQIARLALPGTPTRSESNTSVFASTPSPSTATSASTAGRRTPLASAAGGGGGESPAIKPPISVSRALGFFGDDVGGGNKSPAPAQQVVSTMGSTMNAMSNAPTTPTTTNPINNVGKTADESLSQEQLVVLVRRLRREIAAKETRINDLEDYVDRLLNKVLNRYPELLEKSPPPKDSRKYSKSIQQRQQKPF